MDSLAADIKYGVRTLMALGASRGGVLAMVARQGLLLVAAGLRSA